MKSAVGDSDHRMGIMQVERPLRPWQGLESFVGGAKLLIPYIKLTFNSDGIIVSDIDSKNIETIKYSSVPTNFTDDYILIVDLNELQAVLDTCTEADLTFNFGDKQCLVISRLSIKNIIPEVSMD